MAHTAIDYSSIVDAISTWPQHELKYRQFRVSSRRYCFRPFTHIGKKPWDRIDTRRPYKGLLRAGRRHCCPVIKVRKMSSNSSLCLSGKSPSLLSESNICNLGFYCKPEHMLILSYLFSWLKHIPKVRTTQQHIRLSTVHLKQHV